MNYSELVGSVSTVSLYCGRQDGSYGSIKSCQHADRHHMTTHDDSMAFTLCFKNYRLQRFGLVEPSSSSPCTQARLQHFGVSIVWLSASCSVTELYVCRDMRMLRLYGLSTISIHYECEAGCQLGTDYLHNFARTHPHTYAACTLA